MKQDNVLKNHRFRTVLNIEVTTTISNKVHKIVLSIGYEVHF